MTNNHIRIIIGVLCVIMGIVISVLRNTFVFSTITLLGMAAFIIAGAFVFALLESKLRGKQV